LAFRTTWQTLKDHMRNAGEVMRADIFKKKDGKSKGCGLVEFASVKDVLRAIKELHGTKLDGREIYVREDNKEMASFDKHDNKSDNRDTLKIKRRSSSSRSKSGSRSRSGSRNSRSNSRSRSRSREKSRKGNGRYGGRSRSRSGSTDRKRKDHDRSDRKSIGILIEISQEIRDLK